MLTDIWDEIKQKVKDKIKDFLSSFKYIIGIVILIVLILGIFKLEKVSPEQFDEQQLYFCEISISNWGNWITIITIPVTAIWAIYQYKKSIKIRQQEKATEIAKEFSETIVNDLAILNNVYLESSLFSLIPKEEKIANKIKYFNTNEIRILFDNDDYPTLYKKIRSKKEEELNKLYHLELYTKIAYCSEEEKEGIIQRILRGKETDQDFMKLNLYFESRDDMPYHFLNLQSDTLNKLEYLCMGISSKAADSSYIYQSLHQMFLRCIRVLYLEISFINSKQVDKYYSNIIHVYNLWQSKYKKKRAIENRRIDKSNEELNPKIETI